MRVLGSFALLDHRKETLDRKVLSLDQESKRSCRRSSDVCKTRLSQFSGNKIAGVINNISGTKVEANILGDGIDTVWYEMGWEGEKDYVEGFPENSRLSTPTAKSTLGEIVVRMISDPAFLRDSRVVHEFRILITRRRKGDASETRAVLPHKRELDHDR